MEGPIALTGNSVCLKEVAYKCVLPEIFTRFHAGMLDAKCYQFILSQAMFDPDQHC